MIPETSPTPVIISMVDSKRAREPTGLSGR
jgi:hypothetical protein